jgi:hypothetical protein
MNLKIQNSHREEIASEIYQLRGLVPIVAKNNTSHITIKNGKINLFKQNGDN